MFNIKLDLDKDLKAMFYCKVCEKRMKLTARKKTKCPRCNGKLIHASVHMWRLVDALKEELTKRGLEFRLTEEVPLESEWGFLYYLDCGIWLITDRSHTRYGGVGVVVDLVPANPHGGYQNKISLARNNLHKFDIHVRPVTLKEVNKITVVTTAYKIVDKLVKRSKVNSLPI